MRVTAIVVLAACGGSGGSGTPDAAAPSNVSLSRDCPTPMPQPCTGALDGTWTIATGCYPEPAVLTSCPALGWLMTGEITGTIAFDTTAGTMTRTGNITSETTSSAPADCGCDTVDTYAKQQVTNATCNDSADRCQCSGSNTRDQSQTAHFTVAGSVLTFDDAKTANFCAGASALTLQTLAPDGEVIEVLTLTR